MFSPITDEQNNTLGVIFTCPVSSFTFDIPLNIPVINKKMENQTDLYRLVSPNGNGQFEFSVAKNDGVHFINVDCTYLPYNPFLHLNFDFNLLYGKDFNDATRGLICGGQFSLPIINDQFKTYEINNKNYNNVFLREIENMDTNRKYQRIQDFRNFNSSKDVTTSTLRKSEVANNPKKQMNYEASFERQKVRQNSPKVKNNFVSESKEKKNTKSNKFIVIFFILLIITGVAVGCVFSPTFNLTGVIVNDGVNVTSEEILNSFTVVTGTNIFKINRDREYFKKLEVEIEKFKYLLECLKEEEILNGENGVTSKAK